MAGNLIPFDAAREAMDRPWQWGVADCCTGACDAFLALWGVDPMAELRGKYDDATSAYRAIIARGGWEKMIEGFAKGAGLVPSPGVSGDIGLIKSMGKPALALCVSPGMWAAKNMVGMTLIQCEGIAKSCPR